MKKETMIEFEIGMKVAIRGETLEQDRLRIGKVTRILKRFIELEDGSQFSHNGSIYPRREWSTVNLYICTPELEEEFWRQRFIRVLGARKWDSLPTETLRELVSLSRVEEKAQAAF